MAASDGGSSRTREAACVVVPREVVVHSRATARGDARQPALRTIVPAADTSLDEIPDLAPSSVLVFRDNIFAHVLKHVRIPSQLKILVLTRGEIWYVLATLISA